jgi:hypothetical protein
MAREISTRRSSTLAEFIGEGAKPGEKIQIHQIDELRLVLRVDFKSRGPFNTGPVAVSDRQHPERGAMVTNGNCRADERVGIKALGI